MLSLKKKEPTAKNRIEDKRIEDPGNSDRKKNQAGYANQEHNSRRNAIRMEEEDKKLI